MDEAYTRTYRRFGDSIFEKGEATSYEGSFDDEYNEDDIWKPRVAKRFTQRQRHAGDIIYSRQNPQ